MRAFEYRGPELSGNGHYLPPYAAVVQTPQAGKFYQVHKADTPWRVSRDSYGSANVKKGLYALNDSPWNSFIRKATTGWEAYKIKGLQFQAKYSNNPMRSGYGSGISYPVIWIPAIDGGEPVKPPDKEPKIPYFGPFIPSGPAPETLPPELRPKTPDKPSPEPSPRPGPGPSPKPRPKPGVLPRTPKKKKPKPDARTPKKKRPAEDVVPDKKRRKKKKRPGAQPPKVKIVPVQVPVPVRVPYPVKEKRNEWSPWLVGGIALALGLVVADNRGRR